MLKTPHCISCWALLDLFPTQQQAGCQRHAAVSDHMMCPTAGALTPCYCTGQSADDLRELTVEGTTFDPTTGGVTGLTSLDRNLEVMAQSCASADNMTAQDIKHCTACMLCCMRCCMLCCTLWCSPAGLLKPAIVTCRLCLRCVLSAMMLTLSSRMADTMQWVHPQRPPL